MSGVGVQGSGGIVTVGFRGYCDSGGQGVL